ncbi:MAG: c-type cytochrome [Planctomycetaceae bacterium]
MCSAHWLWAGDRSAADHRVAFSKTFDAADEVASARLVAVADFCRVTVTINGEIAATIEPYVQPIDLDVRRFVRAGRNRIAIEAESIAGPSAVGLSLEIVAADGSRETVETDRSWTVRRIDEDDAEKGDDAPLRIETYGSLAAEAWLRPGRDHRIHETDNYGQWKQALGGAQASDPSAFHVSEGFEIELLRAAGEDEDSWIAVCFDDRGRLIVAREDKGLLRMALSADHAADRPMIGKVETIDDSLEECRGLLWAHGGLYVNANENRGLYRLRDTTGDDRFDEVKLLYQGNEPNAGHGRNGLALGPDGMIYSVHGDAVRLHERFDRDLTSPFREHAWNKPRPQGHVVRCDPDGTTWELFASGLRNPYGLAFDPSGELFTYDADAEYDMGSPWYRPTRVDHLVAGSDFGWRGVTRQWPPYYPDHPENVPWTVDIGKGSPTEVEFGTQSDFPSPYKEALFILDWAYGRILAVHLEPRGAGYVGAAEPFVKGRPLNVTGMDFGPDGAMYFVTGGRKTQSGLYRVRFAGDRKEHPTATPQQLARRKHADHARRVRRGLEAHRASTDADRLPSVLAAIRPHLADPDPTLRYAARTALEHQPIDAWRDRADDESRPLPRLEIALALARAGEIERCAEALAKFDPHTIRELPASQRLIAIRACGICLDRAAGNEPPQIDSARLLRLVDRLYPGDDPAVNRAASALLARHESPGLLEKTLPLLVAAEEQAEELHYLFVLRKVAAGWTPETRQAYFARLRGMRRFQGGEGMPDFIRLVRNDALESVPEAERETFAKLLIEERPRYEDVPPRPVVRKWKSNDVEELLADGNGDGGVPDLARGRRMFEAASCIRCHRVGTEGEAVGPDLTSIAGRFSRRDVLLSVLEPSRVVAEQYRPVQVLTTQGKVFTGQPLPSSDFRAETLSLLADPLRPDRVTEIPKTEIEFSKVLETSPMPEGLLDTLTREEIRDLLAFLETGGKASNVGHR